MMSQLYMRSLIPKPSTTVPRVRLPLPIDDGTWRDITDRNLLTCTTKWAVDQYNSKDSNPQKFIFQEAISGVAQRVQGKNCFNIIYKALVHDEDGGQVEKRFLAKGILPKQLKKRFRAEGILPPPGRSFRRIFPS